MNYYTERSLKLQVSSYLQVLGFLITHLRPHCPSQICPHVNTSRNSYDDLGQYLSHISFTLSHILRFDDMFHSVRPRVFALNQHLVSAE